MRNSAEAWLSQLFATVAYMPWPDFHARLLSWIATGAPLFPPINTTPTRPAGPSIAGFAYSPTASLCIIAILTPACANLNRTVAMLASRYALPISWPLLIRPPFPGTS